MQLVDLTLRPLAIPFTTTFTHHSASRNVADSVWVEATDSEGVWGYGEACPRPYVSGENRASVVAFFERYRADWIQGITSLDDLRAWIDKHESEIDHAPAAFAAVELAIIDLLARRQGIMVEQLLRTPCLAPSYRYTAVVGDGDARQFQQQLALYHKHGFQDFKIKLAGDINTDVAKVNALRAMNVAPQRVRADANNLWVDADSAIDYLDLLDFPFWAVEEPLLARDFTGLAKIALKLNTRLVLDESCLTRKDLSAVAELGLSPWHFVPNLRVSKQGGLLRALDHRAHATRTGHRIIVGAHVGETSLLTRAGLTLAAAAGNHLVAQEGAYGTHLLSKDVVDYPIMFGREGQLDTTGLTEPGFGVVPRWRR